MKISVLKRNLITVYSLVILFTCVLEGCLSQPGEVISQVEKKSEDALLGSKTSSSFNYFDSKKKYSPTQVVSNRKVDGSFPNVKQVEYEEEEKPGRVTISGDFRTGAENASINKVQKTAGPATVKGLESWRSKSLIESAKKFPSKVVNTYHQNSNRTKHTFDSVSRGGSNTIQKIVKTVKSTVERDKTEKTSQDSESSTTDKFRTDELSRYYDQAIQKKAHSEITQLGKDLKRDLEQSKPTFENVNYEMRRLQINTIMERARQAAKQKNYEYARFLAEQAMESSYRGHVAFSPEEESPQELLQHIKSISPVRHDSEMPPIEHTNSKVQSNGGQFIEKTQFSPSAVHPLRKRSTAKFQNLRPHAENSASISQELPLITPRNRSMQRQVPPRHSPVQEPKTRSHGILLEPPAFEQTLEEPADLSERDKIQAKKSNSGTQPELQQKLEEIPDEPAAKIKISGPEPVKQESENESKNSTSPGPKLMLPKLPSVPQDLTSQTGEAQAHRTTVLNHSGQNQKTQTAPVKFQAKIQKQSQHEPGSLVEQNSAGAKENGEAIQSSLVLDEIEWDLEEKQQPQPKSSWWGMSTVLLMISGLIILMLLTIIVVLLRRGNSAS